tara:strand:+ start:1204 stop:2229 length:1026 start_codon:yes stop_codon:yes gene_type:complete
MRIIFIILIIISYNKSIYAKSLFETNFYEISFVSNNIDEYKINKINEIKNDSINKIFKQILVKEDFLKLKKSINIDLINTFIKNIIINDEKIIDQYYFSRIKINFNKKNIINYLRKYEIPYVEYHPKDFLTIIYEKNNLSKILFSTKNLHYDFIKKNNNNYYKVPNLDINDKYMLGYLDIENNNYERIKSFINKYSKDEAVIITADYENNKIKYKILLYLNNSFSNLSNLESMDNNLNLFFDNLYEILIDEWKIKNKIQNKFINIINCEINYFNLLELKQIKNNLSDISIIKKYNLKKISLNKNKYDIHYFGNIEVMIKLLHLNDLRLKLDTNNHCKIYLK